MKLVKPLLFVAATLFAPAGTWAGDPAAREPAAHERAPQDRATARDPLAPLDFLIGTWKGVSAGAASTDRFRRDLDGHILQRRSHSMVRGADGKSRAMRTFLAIYPSADYTGFDALYLDNMGHVIVYDAVTVVPGQSAQFTSVGSASAPSFRLTYTLKTPAVLHVTFAMAPAAQPATPAAQPLTAAAQPRIYQAIAEADETRSH